MACNETDFGRLLKAILTAYPTFKALRDPGAAEMWFRMLKEFDYDDLSRALEAHIRQSKFPPTLAELSAAAKNGKIDKLVRPLALPEHGTTELRKFDTWEELEAGTGGNYTMAELEYMLLRQAERLHRHENESLRTAALIES